MIIYPSVIIHKDKKKDFGFQRGNPEKFQFILPLNKQKLTCKRFNQSLRFTGHADTDGIFRKK